MWLVYCQRFLDTNKIIKHNVTFPMNCQSSSDFYIAMCDYDYSTHNRTFIVKYRYIILCSFIITNSDYIYFVYNFVVHDLY